MSAQEDLDLATVTADLEAAFRVGAGAQAFAEQRYEQRPACRCRLKQRVTVLLVVEARLVADDAGGYDTKCEPVHTCIPPPATSHDDVIARHSAALERDGVGLGCSPHTSAADRQKHTVAGETRSAHGSFGRS